MRTTISMAAVALVVALLVGTATSLYLLRSGAVADRVRAELTHSLQVALGREVSIGGLAGDPWRGIVLRDVRIARHERLADGALLRARSATVVFDPAALLADLWSGSRTTIPAIRRVVVHEPIVALVRAPEGRWNVEDLFRPPPPGVPPAPAPPAFRGEIEISNGVVHFLDRFTSPRVDFRALLTNVGATLSLRDNPLLRVQVSGRAAAGRPSDIAVRGWVQIEDGTLSLDLRADRFPVRTWGNYLLYMPRIRWEEGTASAALHLYSVPHAVGPTLDFQGTVDLHGAALRLVPEDILVSGLVGPMRVETTSLRTDGLRVQAGRGSAVVRGEMLLAGQGRLDIEVDAQRLDLGLVRRLFFPDAVAMRGQASGRLRLAGPMDAVRVEGTVRSPEAAVEHIPLRDVVTNLNYAAGVLALTELRAAAAGGAIQGDLVLGDSRYFAAANLNRIPTDLGTRFGVVLPVSTRATGQIVVGGGPEGTTVAGALSGQGGSAFGFEIDTLRASFTYDSGRLRLDSAVARRGPMSVAASGTVSARGDLDIFAVARAVPLRLVTDRTGGGDRIGGTLGYAGRIRGTSQMPVLDGTVLLTDGFVGRLSFDDWVADLTLTPTHADVRWSTLRDGGDLYRIAGRARWGADPALALTVETEGVRASRLATLAEVPVPVEGSVDGVVRVGGTPEQPRVQADVRLVDGAVAGQRVDEARARFAWQDGRLDLHEATGRAGNSTVRIAGTLDPAGRLRLSLLADRIRLEEIGALANPYLRVSGDVRLEGTVSGTIRDPLIDAAVASSRVALNGQVFDTVDGRARWRSGVLLLLPLRLHQDTSAYVAEGWMRLVGTPAAQLSLDVRNARLATLLAISHSPLDMDGTIDGRVTLSGPLGNPRAHMDLSLRDGHYNRYPIRSASGQLLLSDRRVTINNLELVPKQGRLRAQGFVDLEGTSEIEISGEGLEVDALRSVLRLRYPLAGTMNFTLQVSGPLRDPVVGLSAEMVNFGVRGAVVERVLGQVFYDDGFVNIQQILIEAHGQRARIEGQIPARADTLSLDPTRPLSLRLSTDRADIGLLRLAIPAIEEAAGPLDVQVDVTGTTAEPVMAGYARVRDGRVRIGGLSPAIERIDLDLRFDGGGATVERLQAEFGGGRLEAGGRVTFRDLRPDTLDLRLRASAVRLEAAPFYKGQVDGDLRLDGTAARPRLSGRLVLSAGEMLLSLPAGNGAGIGTNFPLAFSLDLVAGDGLFVGAGPLRLSVGGQLRLGGTLARPTLAGTVTAGGGEYWAFGTAFVLEEGTAVFQEFRGIEPLVSARARTRVGDVTVYVHIHGTPGQMDLSLSSDPPLPHDRIVSLLAAQAGISQALEGDVEALLRRQLTRLLFGQFEAQLRQALGLSEFRIEYDFEHPLRLQFGRFLIQNVYLTLTTVFDWQVRFLWALEYRFAPGIALAFTYDYQGLWLMLLRARFVW